jgi:hypothetical protein
MRPISALADTRGITPNVILLSVITCPKCGAARLLPLHFPVYRLEEAAEAIVRPIAKCSGCRQRVFAHVAIRKRSMRPTERPAIMRGPWGHALSAEPTDSSP